MAMIGRIEGCVRVDEVAERCHIGDDRGSCRDAAGRRRAATRTLLVSMVMELCIKAKGSAN